MPWGYGGKINQNGFRGGAQHTASPWQSLSVHPGPGLHTWLPNETGEETKKEEYPDRTTKHPYRWHPHPPDTHPHHQRFPGGAVVGGGGPREGRGLGWMVGRWGCTLAPLPDDTPATPLGHPLATH